MEVIASHLGKETMHTLGIFTPSLGYLFILPAFLCFISFSFNSKVCANCKCPRENHDVSVDVDLDGVEFKVRGLNINTDINNEDDLPAPPPMPHTYNEYPTVTVTNTEITPVDNDFFPPPPPSSTASDYIWSPPGLTAGQVKEQMLGFFLYL